MKLEACVICFRVKYQNNWVHFNRLLVDNINKERLRTEKTICPECKDKQKQSH